MRRGFTFIEVLTVIMIAAIVLLVVAIGTGAARSNARDERRRADLATISSVLEKFRSDCRKYPTGSEFGAAVSSGFLRGNGATPACSNSSVYTSRFPKDPEPGRVYYYGVDATGQDYTLCAALETEPVPPMTGSCIGSSSCGPSCNYILTSP